MLTAIEGVNKKRSASIVPTGKKIFKTGIKGSMKINGKINSFFFLIVPQTPLISIIDVKMIDNIDFKL